MRLFCTIPLILCAAGAYAQVLNVDSVQELKLQRPVERAVIAPSGEYLLLSDYNYSGLTKVDLQSKKEKIVTRAAGAGYNAKVLDNGDIVYREVTQAPLKKTAIKRYFSSTGNTETIVRSTRNSVQPESTIEANNVTTGTDFQLHLTINGEKRILSPLGSDKRYLWPSISPDGKRLLFFVSADCAYVSDIDGKNAKPMGILRAPKWYGNDIIIGQRDLDNGYVTTSSSIIAKNISTGKEQVLTKDDMIAMYPSVSKKGDKILFSTPEGKAYIIHVNVKQ